MINNGNKYRYITNIFFNIPLMLNSYLESRIWNAGADLLWWELGPDL